MAVRNDDGELNEESRVDNEDPEPIAERYAGGEALLEATTNYFYIYAMLSEYLDVKVGHPPKLQSIVQTDKKTDQIDAKELSRLLWLGSVPESYVPTGEIRECRALVRGRISLLQERTMYANKIHSLLLNNGITRQVKPLSAAGREFLQELSLPAPGDGLLASYLSVIGTLTTEIGDLDKRTEKRAEGLEATGKPESWQFDLRFQSHDSLSAFQENCVEHSVPNEVRGLYYPTKPDAGPWFGLSPAQQIMLTRAVEEGSYSIPWQISTAELGDQFDISDQSVTERLRRRIRNLVSGTLTVTDSA